MKLKRDDADDLRREAGRNHDTRFCHARVLLAIAEHLDMLPAEPKPEPKPEPKFKPGDCVRGRCSHWLYLVIGHRYDDIWNLVHIDRDAGPKPTTGLTSNLKLVAKEEEL